MTFLPIVGRELRVATRRRSTYWLRVIAAGVALLIGAGMLLLSLLPFAGAMPGSVLFGTLTWMSLAAALSGGLFFTSDCLSEEKREGTLGFLFLTDLRGYDVVIGKLLVTSLRSVSPLLAIFPILATTLLIGGVDVGHFWRAMLAIANAAFFSLATGMFVSAISRNALKALAGTLFLLVILVGGGPVMDSLGAFVNGRFIPTLSLVSPGYAFSSANYAKTFWPAFAVSNVTAWLLLALSCFLVRRTWQEKPASTRRVKLPLQRIVPAHIATETRRRRLQLLDENPVTWLATRYYGHALILWIVAVMMSAAFLVFWFTDAPTMFWHGWEAIHNCVSLALYLWVTAKACQFFADARRTGAIELLLASPLTSRATVQGAWQGLLRLFAPPILLLIILEVAADAIAISADWMSEDFPWIHVANMVLNVVLPMANLVALAWFGLWMGLTSKNALTATLKTIALVQIVPWFAIYFLTAMSVPLFMFSGGWPAASNASSQTMVTQWVPLLFVLVPATLGLLKNFLFWLGARRKLFGQFRQLATRSLVPVHSAHLPPVIKATP